MIMPGVLQWHVPSKLFMWQKPKGYLSTWTWRNMCQPSTRKYQVLGHPCCRTGQILGWLGDIRNCAYSWRCTEKVGKVKGTIKHNYIVREEGEGEYHKSFNRSTLQDFLAGRSCEIDNINGAVAAEAVKVGLCAPVNETVSSLVRALEGDARKRRRLG